VLGLFKNRMLRRISQPKSEKEHHNLYSLSNMSYVREIRLKVMNGQAVE
jgi:hypothetical protein